MIICALYYVLLIFSFSISAFGQNEQDLFDVETKLNIQDEKKLSTKSKDILKNLRDDQLTSNTKIVKLNPINNLRNLPNIAITINEQLQYSGNHVVQWKRKDEKNVSNGYYMYRIKIGSKQFTKPITAIK